VISPAGNEANKTNYIKLSAGTRTRRAHTFSNYFFLAIETRKVARALIQNHYEQCVLHSNALRDGFGTTYLILS